MLWDMTPRRPVLKAQPRSRIGGNMEYNQSSETVRTVTDDGQTKPISQNVPTDSSSQVETDRLTGQVASSGSTSQVDTVRISKIDSRNRVSSITRVVYWLLGILESLLAIRLVLKLLGASTSSSFVTFIYNATKIFVAPFSGIFRSVESGFETSTLIAMIVYALAGWGIAKFVAIVTNSSSGNR